MFVLILICCVISIVNCANFEGSLNNKTRVTRNADYECGVGSETSGLISGGQEIKRGAYPWLVAIWLREENKQPKYICGGNLISARKVVTAAHCLHYKNENTASKPKDLLLMFGAFNLNDFLEPRIQVVPSEVKIHEDWNPFVERFNDDIAIITLEEDIKFTRFIRPICLLKQNVNDYGTEGIVVGWGKSEDQTKIHENIPRSLRIPIESNEECYRSESNLAKIGSRNSFCAGKPGVGVCTGDSGSGFMVKIANRFHLKGLVSSSLVGEDGCYTKNYAIYTDVPKYVDWIENTETKLTTTPRNIKFVTEATTTTSTTNSNVSNKQTCGVMSASTGLVVGGEFSSREQFPWVVQVLEENDGKFEMRGAGTLISDRHIVTEANSVSTSFENTKFMVPVRIERIKLILGSTQFDSADEPGSMNKGESEIKRIVVYPFAQYGVPSISDIAVITLKTSVTFSRYISPVCLWEFNSKIDEIVGKTAFGVGYGWDQNNEFTSVKKHVPMIIDNQERCKEFWGHRLIIGNTSEYFCASGRTGNVANFYDDPLYIKFNDIWFLRGLMNMRNALNGKIDADKPLLYENTAIYVKWIKDQML